MNAVLNAIEKRSSTRGYTEEKLTPEELETLILAGLQAPTAANKQEIHLSVIEGSNPILRDQDSAPQLLLRSSGRDDPERRRGFSLESCGCRNRC